MRLLLLSLSCAISTLVFAQQPDAAAAAARKMTEVLYNVERFYVDAPNANKLSEAAIVALLEELDPHSTYIPKEDLDDAQMQINGSFVGIGVRFQLMKDTISVVATIPGGPSENSAFYLAIKSCRSMVRTSPAWASKTIRSVKNSWETSVPK